MARGKREPPAGAGDARADEVDADEEGVQQREGQNGPHGPFRRCHACAGLGRHSDDDRRRQPGRGAGGHQQLAPDGVDGQVRRAVRGEGDGRHGGAARHGNVGVGGSVFKLAYHGTRERMGEVARRRGERGGGVPAGAGAGARPRGGGGGPPSRSCPTARGCR